MSRRAILVVSPIPVQLEAWRAAVRRAGCLSLEASTVERARALLLKIRPSLILISASLAASGASLVAAVSENPVLSTVPVVVMGAPGELEAFREPGEGSIRPTGVETVGDRLAVATAPLAARVLPEPDTDELVALLREMLTPTSTVALPVGDWAV